MARMHHGLTPDQGRVVHLYEALVPVGRDPLPVVPGRAYKAVIPVLPEESRTLSRWLGLVRVQTPANVAGSKPSSSEGPMILGLGFRV